MSFLSKYTPEQREAIRVWEEADRAFRAECSLFQRAIRTLPKFQYRSDADHAFHALARARHKKAWHAHAEAESQYKLAMRSNEVEQQRSAEFEHLLGQVRGPEIADKAMLEHEAKRAMYGQNKDFQVIAEAARAFQESKKATSEPQYETTDEIKLPFDDETAA